MNAGKERTPHEFELIARYFRRPSTDPAVLIGSGDDAALVQPSDAVALSTDTLVAGVHFLETIDPARLAEKALAVNLSDMAAMGARPRWFTLALTLPQSEPGWLGRFSEGLHACAARFDVSLVGGDVTAGPLCISIHIAGEVSPEAALRRDGAAIGDSVFVTGTLGDAAAGLQIVRGESAESADAQYLIDRYELPTPRVDAGIALRGIATAAIDVSDGLLADLGHLCAASGCAARVAVEALPLSQPLQRCFAQHAAREFALFGGDDYELCFTAPRDADERITVLLAPLGVSVTRIGECLEGSGVECRLAGERYSVRERGYEHFS
ncbi:MAG: thiamine-phosphate kinase [Gammaproteobacteria bacterium]